MMTNANTTPLQNPAEQAQAAIGLAMVRMTIGAMLVWVFFENLGKGLYTPAGYAGLINYYIKASHSPAAWKAVMGFMASHAAMAAPMQALTEISLGTLLVVGLLTRPVAQRETARPTTSASDASTGTSSSQIHAVPHSETHRLPRYRNATRATGRVSKPTTSSVPREISVRACIGAAIAA